MSDIPEYEHIPFHAWRHAPQVMPNAHVHTDLELNLLLSGGARYFFAGRFHDIAPDRLALFWAGMPHRLVRVQPGTEYLCMTLPLAWFLSWGLGPALTDRLLGGELLLAGAEQGAEDRALLSRWAADLARDRGDGAARRIVLLELEARLRRLSRALEGEGEYGVTPSAEVPGPAAHAAERIAGHLSRHYQDTGLSAASVGAAVGLHPNYAMAAFKAGCGTTLWAYLTRLRVSHAQRLLLTTDWTVERIARECGFASMSRFFAVFRRLVGCTPRQYRVGHAQERPGGGAAGAFRPIRA